MYEQTPIDWTCCGHEFSYPIAGSLQHITEHILGGVVATEAQCSEREAWEASTLPLSYARAILRLITEYICKSIDAQL